MLGGQNLDEFVTKHFTKVGEKNPRTNRWKMKCSYRTPPWSNTVNWGTRT